MLKRRSDASAKIAVMAAVTEVLNPSQLRPYASFAVLRYDGPDVSMGCTAAMVQLRRMAERQSRARTVEVLASGLPDGWVEQNVLAAEVSVAPARADLVVACDAIAVRVTKPASWAKADAPFNVVADELGYVVQRGRLVAIHCPPSQVDSLQRWLDGDPKPAFKRVRGALLQTAFLRGAARGLWLRGTHRRQATKADSKNLSGVSLGEALSPFEDASFALSSGRATAEGPAFTAIEGTVGTTPRKAWVWNQRAESFVRLVEVALETLEIVAGVIDNPPSDLPFPELAVELDSLTGVASAVDAYVPEPEEVRQIPGATEDLVEAAEVLRDVIIDVQGDVSGPNFTLTVGPAGDEVGRLRCRPRMDGDRATVDVGLAGTPSDAQATAEIRNALDDNDELLVVHYETGHVLARNGLSRVNTLHKSFKNWDFVDVSEFDFRREKPDEQGSQAIHDAIGVDGEDSLFSWVVRTFSDGYLTCDDGANEVADFVHLAPDDKLTLIHVKAAGKAESHRMATGAFELVAAQAEKNLRYLQVERLIPALQASPIKAAVWTDGDREADRTNMINALLERPEVAETQVIILQPHHHLDLHSELRGIALAGGQSRDLARLHLVETLLNSARAAAVGMGSELLVWGRKHSP